MFGQNRHTGLRRHFDFFKTTLNLVFSAWFLVRKRSICNCKNPEYLRPIYRCIFFNPPNLVNEFCMKRTDLHVPPIGNFCQLHNAAYNFGAGECANSVFSMSIFFVWTSVQVIFLIEQFLKPDQKNHKPAPRSTTRWPIFEKNEQWNDWFNPHSTDLRRIYPLNFTNKPGVSQNRRPWL